MIAIRSSFIAFLILLTCTSIAQTKTSKAKVKWGPDMTIKDNGLFDEVIGDVENATYMLMHRKKDAFIQRMDGLKVTWQKPLELELDKKDVTLQAVILTKTQILVFASLYDKKGNENNLYLSSYDQDGFNSDKISRK